MDKPNHLNSELTTAVGMRRNLVTTYSGVLDCEYITGKFYKALDAGLRTRLFRFVVVEFCSFRLNLKGIFKSIKRRKYTGRTLCREILGTFTSEAFGTLRGDCIKRICNWLNVGSCVRCTGSSAGRNNGTLIIFLAVVASAILYLK